MLPFPSQDGSSTLEQLLLAARFNLLIRKYPNLPSSVSSTEALPPQPAVALPPSAAQRRKIGGDRERMFRYATKHTWKQLTNRDEDYRLDGSINNKRE